MKSAWSAVAALVGITAVTLVAGAVPAPADLTPTSEPRALQPVAPTSKLIPGTRCRAFPASNVWHSDISRLPRHPLSDRWMASAQAAGGRLHPDFGPSFGEQPVPYGIPITIDRSPRPRARVRFGYADESDRVRYPLTRRTLIEGGWNASGDRHAIVIHARSCRLYETWDTRLTPSGWYAGSGATWNLRANGLRPAGWTSADAAGLAILPGLLRWDEIQAGRVDHAIRFTLARTRNSYIWPARHRAGSTDDPGVPPMGARFRLRANFDMSPYSPRARVVLLAMKRFGLMLADNGSNWYFQGTADTRWPIALIDELKRVPASSFEAVDASSLMVSANRGVARR